MVLKIYSPVSELLLLSALTVLLAWVGILKRFEDNLKQFNSILWFYVYLWSQVNYAMVSPWCMLSGQCITISWFNRRWRERVFCCVSYVFACYDISQMWKIFYFLFSRKLNFNTLALFASSQKLSQVLKFEGMNGVCTWCPAIRSENRLLSGSPRAANSFWNFMCWIFFLPCYFNVFRLINWIILVRFHEFSCVNLVFRFILFASALK